MFPAKISVNGGAMVSGGLHGAREPARGRWIRPADQCQPGGHAAWRSTPIDCARLDASAIVADVVIQAERTLLLLRARERGCFVQPGTAMSDHQVPEMAEIFGSPGGDWSPGAITQAMAG